LKILCYKYFEYCINSKQYEELLFVLNSLVNYNILFYDKNFSKFCIYTTLKVIHGYPQRLKINPKWIFYTTEELLKLIIELIVKFLTSMTDDSRYMMELDKVRSTRDVLKAFNYLKDLLIQVNQIKSEDKKYTEFILYLVMKQLPSNNSYSYKNIPLLGKDKAFQLLLAQGRPDIKDIFINFYQLPKVFNHLDYITTNLFTHKSAILCFKAFKEDIRQYFSSTENIINLLLSFRTIIKYKPVKKFLADLIDTLDIETNYDCLVLLIRFYVQKLLNPTYQQMFKFQRYDNNENLNAISLFKINEKIIFYVRYKQQTVISVNKNISKVLAGFEIIFKKLAKAKEILNNRDWWEDRKKLENEFETCLFEFQKALFSNEVRRIFKSIFMDNKNYTKLLSHFYENNHVQINNDFNTFLSEVTEELISYYPNKKPRNKIYALIINEFFSNKKIEIFNHSDCLNQNQIFYYIVSSELANIPLESLPILSNFIIIRNFIYESINIEEKDLFIPSKDVYCIVNPSKDLKDTEDTLKPYISSFKGIVGTEPNRTELLEVLKRIKFLFYAGHHNGSKYIDTSFIKNNEVSFITMLMGCSSVKIENLVGPKDEPFDIVSYYVLNKW
jgi:hypothetical protein